MSTMLAGLVSRMATLEKVSSSSISHLISICINWSGLNFHSIWQPSFGSRYYSTLTTMFFDAVSPGSRPWVSSLSMRSSLPVTIPKSCCIPTLRSVFLILSISLACQTGGFKTEYFVGPRYTAYSFCLH